MLLKKTAFSLMSLITLLALAFVAPSAMAGEFGVALDATGDVSSAGDLQLAYPADDSLEVTVKFDQAVLFDAATAFVTTYDKNGKLVDIPVATGAPAKTVASKEIILTIPVEEGVVKVNIKIAKGIASADPINADTSKALDINIFLVGSDVGGPTVYSIRRADNPLLPVSAATVQVIVTLSELPKEFKKGNLSITDNATITKEPEALVPIAEIPADVRYDRAALEARLAGGTPPARRELYDATSPSADGIHTAINADDDYVDPGVDGTETGNFTLVTVEPDADATIPAPVAVPDKTFMTAMQVTVDGAVEAVPAVPEDGAIVFPIGTDRTAKPGKAPNPADFVGNADAFAAEVALHNALMTVYMQYTNEYNRHIAYMDAVAAEKAIDNKALEEYLEINLNIDQVLLAAQTSTGRDSMLHPYVVTIAPKYPAGKADIVLKVGAFEDTTVPTPLKYTPPDKRVPVEGVYRKC